MALPFMTFYCVILKTLHILKIKRAHEARDSQYLFQTFEIQLEITRAVN